MMNFMTLCYFPCLCEQCQEIVQVDLLARKQQCPKCRATDLIPYVPVRRL